MSKFENIYAIRNRFAPGIAWATNASSIYRMHKGLNLMLTDIMKSRLISVILAIAILSAIWITNNHNHNIKGYSDLKFESHGHHKNCSGKFAGCGLIHNFARTNGLITNNQNIPSSQIIKSYISFTSFIFSSTEHTSQQTRAPPLV